MPTQIYIASAPRSGSTLLANLLGNHPDIFNVGEIHNLSDFLSDGPQGQRFGGKCACGRLVRECEVWEPVIREVVQNLGLAEDRDIVTRVSGRMTSAVNRYSKTIMWASMERNLRRRKEYKEVATFNYALMNAVVINTGCRAVVNSSKTPDMLTLNWIFRAEGWDVKVVYLKRDLCANAFSMIKGMKRNGQKPHSFIRVCFGIQRYNRLLEAVCAQLPDCNVLRVSHETFCQKPRAEMERIVKFIDQNMSIDGFMKNRPNRHDIGGSVSVSKPLRLSDVRMDDAWKEKCTLVHQACAAAASLFG